MNIIGMYEAMGEMSQRMVEAAQANDWSRLTDLERNVASLRDTLKTEDRQPLTEEERNRKVRIIHRILDADAEVRRHTEPWMSQVRQFLNASTRDGKSLRPNGAAT